ncbi:YeeE/YedE family protein [Methanofollis formosanus]|uniref:YeeE/YedE family protein n=1 Tax=Methanofollis formosanus TaxID=299308 RepID=A0A8G1EEA0_9EURY|nr:YeeE/YedE thiosulfate transporter family protein [Methanofollis formosanus]QYZ78028.1 YeeE/YedE family protein [Methanofollis formosanus]
MLTALHKNARAQLLIGLLIGIGFGFFLQKGGVTSYDVIVGQLLLQDFTVVKLMLSAVIVGMIGFYFLKGKEMALIHCKNVTLGSVVIGGLIFGAGFAVLGYCPGTVAGAVGQGWLDALVGGVLGMVVGAGAFARLYPRLVGGILARGEFDIRTIPEVLRVNEWVVVAVFVVLMLAVLYLLEVLGL